MRYSYGNWPYNLLGVVGAGSVIADVSRSIQRFLVPGLSGVEFAYAPTHLNWLLRASPIPAHYFLADTPMSKTLALSQQIWRRQLQSIPRSLGLASTLSNYHRTNTLVSQSIAISSASRASWVVLSKATSRALEQPVMHMISQICTMASSEWSLGILDSATLGSALSSISEPVSDATPAQVPVALSEEAEDSIVARIEQAVDERLAEVGFYSNETSIDDKIQQILTLVQEQSDPFWKQVWKSLIVGIIITLLSFCGRNLILGFDSSSTSSTAWQMPKSANAEVYRALKTVLRDVQIPPADLSGLRVVTAYCLDVRQSSSRASRIIGRLFAGQVVTVVKSNRSWALVVWTDGTGEVALQGWVFNRYIARLK